MAGILFVHEGDDHARRVYEHERRAYWTCGFPVVLEKHGYLGFDVAGPAALADRSLTDAYDLILVGRLTDAVWTRELIERLAAGRAQTLVDGPASEALRGALGVTGASPSVNDAVFRGTSSELAGLAFENFGLMSATKVGPPAPAKDQPRSPAQDWRVLGVPISERRAEAWRVPTWDPVHWDVEPDAEVLAEWEVEGRRPTPAIVRRGSLAGCSFGLFEYLTQLHTSPPFNSTEYLSSPPPHGLEAYLLTLIDRLIADAGGVRVRVEPWPLGAEWALSVRHDFDRALLPSQVAHVLSEHHRVRTAATWYWRASHLTRKRPASLRSLLGDESRTRNKAALRLVAEDPRHEIALHTERPWPTGERELRIIEQHSGARIGGTCAHGDPECFRFQGAPNILWAESHGLDYTESIQHYHLHPYRFVELLEDGRIEISELFCLPKHQSFDRSTLPGETYAEQVADSVSRYRQTGGLLQVMNHPDIHVAELFDLLASLPRSRRVNWTAGQAIAWWSATHHSGRLRLASDSSARVSVAASDPILQGALELRAPDGTTRRRLMHAEQPSLEPVALIDE